jgi:hypothetical protein
VKGLSPDYTLLRLTDWVNHVDRVSRLW